MISVAGNVNTAIYLFINYQQQLLTVLNYRDDKLSTHDKNNKVFMKRNIVFILSPIFCVYWLLYYLFATGDFSVSTLAIIFYEEHRNDTTM